MIDSSNPRSTVKSVQSRSTLVAGIYSTKPGFIGSERDWDKPITGGDGENVGTYTLGDMAAEFNEIPLAVVGTGLGKALGSLTSGTGMIKVLVTLN